MGLDFSELNNAVEKIKTETPADSPLTSKEVSNRSDSLTSYMNANNDRALAVYQQYMKNISLSGTLLTEILQGVKLAESPITLLLKALKALSLVNNDTPFYEQSKAGIKAVYGFGLCNEAALNTELSEVQTRLEKLRHAAKLEELEPGEKSHLKNAIDAHKRRQALLLRLIGGNQENLKTDK